MSARTNLLAVCLLALAVTASFERTAGVSPTPVIERPPWRSERDLALDAVLDHVLNHDDLKGSREFYGTPGDARVALVELGANLDTEAGHIPFLPWPDDYLPGVKGNWQFLSRHEDDPIDHDNQPRLLGIRLDKFELRPTPKDTLFHHVGNAPIQVTVFNAGGASNGAVKGGCLVFFVPMRDQGRWIIECTGQLDP